MTRSAHNTKTRVSETKKQQPKQASLQRSTAANEVQLQQSAVADPANATPSAILSLQRSYGNGAVQRLIQTKLTVGAADDAYEREADRVAAEVLSRSSLAPNDAASGAVAHAGDEKYTARRKPSLTSIAPAAKRSAVPPSFDNKIRRADQPANDLRDSFEAGSAIEGKLASSAGEGSPLPDATRKSIEPHFGTDFCSVRLHSGADSSALNRQLGARAFTHQNHIYLGDGASASDSGLMAHELTHVVQQGAATTARRLPGQGRNAIQRFNKKKQAKISGKLTELAGDNSPVTAAGGTYVAGFKGSKEGKKQEKEAQGLLHLPGKSEDDASKEARMSIRAALMAELAAGRSAADLEEYKAYLLAIQGTNELAKVIKCQLKGAAGIAKGLVRDALNAGCSPHVGNIIAARSTALFESQPGEIANLQATLDEVYDKTMAMPTQGKPQLHRMKAAAVEARTLLTEATSAVQERRYVDLERSLKSVRVNVRSVYMFTKAAEVEQAGGYQSGNEVGQARQLGGGQVSKVYEVNYQPGTGSITHGVFKQEEYAYQAADSPGADASGIAQSGANLSNRAVASSEVDELFGGGVTPKTELGSHKGVFGSVQDWAQGSSPMKATSNEEGEVTNTQFRDFDYTDPELQRQLSILQLMDAITGQVDRHGGNFYIKQDGTGTKVTAIDNDFSFGVNKNDPSQRLVDPVWQDRPLGQDFSKGMPLFVDRTVAETVLATPPDALRVLLARRLRPNEVTASLTRLQLVKNHLGRLQTNTAHIKSIQQKVDLLGRTKQNMKNQQMQKLYGPELDQTLKEEQDALSVAYSNGALLDQGEWGQRVGQHLTAQNSYLGMLIEMTEQSRLQGKVIPK